MIVTATQRSGTKTMSELLGIKHENRFDPLLTTTKVKALKRIDSEVSWLAAPFLKHLRNHKIIHLTRHPLRVINSIVGIQFFNKSIAHHTPYRDFVYKYSQVDPNAKDIAQAMQYWTLWNTMIEPYAHARIRIEDIKTKIHLNSRPRADIQSYQDLPTGTIFDQLKTKAYEYGYTA